MGNIKWTVLDTIKCWIQYCGLKIPIESMCDLFSLLFSSKFCTEMKNMCDIPIETIKEMQFFVESKRNVNMYFNKFNVKFYYFWSCCWLSYFFFYCCTVFVNDTLIQTTILQSTSIMFEIETRKWNRNFPAKHSKYFTLSYFSRVISSDGPFISIQFFCVVLCFLVCFRTKVWSSS